MRRLRFLWALCLTLSVPAMADAVDLLSDSSLTDLVPFVQYACMPGPDVARTSPRIASFVYSGDHQPINACSCDAAEGKTEDFRVTRTTSWWPKVSGRSVA